MLNCVACFSQLVDMVARGLSTHILIRNDLDTDHVAGGVEDLLQNIFSHPSIETTHIKRSLVRLWCSSANDTT